jgi:hypothetical protein
MIGRAAVLAMLLAGAATAGAAQPLVVVVMDDLGARPAQDRRAMALPGATCAFLPEAGHTRELAPEALRRGCELMLHLPMDTTSGRASGPGGLHAAMDDAALGRALRAALAAVPGVRGVNNHMGSALTASRPHMDALMQSLRHLPGLYFVDSRTTAQTQAEAAAQAAGVPAARRDVFLDAPGTRIADQWQLLLHKARDRGAAIGIAHPLDSSLDFLEQALPALPAQGMRAAPVSVLIEQRQLALAAGREPATGGKP